MSARTEKLVFWAVVVLLFSAFAAQLWIHLTRTSVTVDEPFHILAGHRHWQCGDFGINPEHPPLLKLLATAPLQLREVADPPWECGSKYTPKFDGFSYGATFLVDNGVDSVVIPTRTAAALMSLILAVLVFCAAWEMFGRWEAVAALAIVAFEPSLIAHGSIVTTDMAISATSFGAVYALYRYGKGHTWLRFGIAAVVLGLMLSAKHSAVIFVGILFVLAIGDAVLTRSDLKERSREVLRQAGSFAAMFVVALAILWAFYGFHYRAIGNESLPEISVADHIKEFGRPETIDSLPARVTDLISRTHIFPESYVLGMADVISWSSRNTMIFGQAYPTGKWFYFPLAFVVKSNLALLCLLPFGLALLYLEPSKRREVLFLLVPAVAFFLFASSSNFTTGIRHLLPVYGFLTVLAAAGAVWIGRKFGVLRYLVVALLIVNAWSAVRAAPNYIVFANVIWGGYENTHKIFLDSSVETGQNMKLVSEYLAEQEIADCWIATFVHPDMIRAVQPCRPMPSGVRIMVSRDLIDPVPPVIEGTVVLSVRELPPGGAYEYVPIAKSEPVAFIGGNTYVYRGRFEVPLAAAISRVHRANHFLRVGDVEQALAEARQAVEFGPDDPRPHLALGLALVKSAMMDEGRQHLELAASLAAKDPIFRNAEVRARQELSKLK